MLFHLRSGSNAAKILTLQLQARRPRLYIHIPGPFVQKGSLGAHAIFRAVREETERAIERHDWPPVPRARVAVEMRFFSHHTNVPAIHNLVEGIRRPDRF